MKNPNLNTVLVTGGAGYVGAVTIPKLLKEGYKVKVYDLYMYGEHVFGEHKKNPNLIEIKADLRDEKKLDQALEGVDAVIDMFASRTTLAASLGALAVGGRLGIIGAHPPKVYGEEPSFLVDPIRFLHRGLESCGTGR